MTGETIRQYKIGPDKHTYNDFDITAEDRKNYGMFQIIILHEPGNVPDVFAYACM